jgi:hypothetical protein
MTVRRLAFAAIAFVAAIVFTVLCLWFGIIDGAVGP